MPAPGHCDTCCADFVFSFEVKGSDDRVSAHFTTDSVLASSSSPAWHTSAAWGPRSGTELIHFQIGQSPTQPNSFMWLVGPDMQHSYFASCARTLNDLACPSSANCSWMFSSAETGTWAPTSVSIRCFSSSVVQAVAPVPMATVPMATVPTQAASVAEQVEICNNNIGHRWLGWVLTCLLLVACTSVHRKRCSKIGSKLLLGSRGLILRARRARPGLDQAWQALGLILALFYLSAMFALPLWFLLFPLLYPADCLSYISYAFSAMLLVNPSLCTRDWQALLTSSVYRVILGVLYAIYILADDGPCAIAKVRHEALEFERIPVPYRKDVLLRDKSIFPYLFVGGSAMAWGPEIVAMLVSRRTLQRIFSRPQQPRPSSAAHRPTTFCSKTCKIFKDKIKELAATMLSAGASYPIGLFDALAVGDLLLVSMYCIDRLRCLAWADATTPEEIALGITNTSEPLVIAPLEVVASPAVVSEGPAADAPLEGISTDAAPTSGDVAGASGATQ